MYYKVSSTQKDVMYTVGRIAQLLYPGPFPDNLPADLLDTLLVKPATGLAQMLEACSDEAKQDWSIQRQLELIPDDFADPGPDQRVDNHDRARFLAGCRQKREPRRPPSFDAPLHLSEVGTVLYGFHWRKPLAIGLGIADMERIERWERGIEPIPLDVCWELHTQVIQRYQKCLKIFPAIFTFTEAERERQGLPRIAPR